MLVHQSRELLTQSMVMVQVNKLAHHKDLKMEEKQGIEAIIIQVVMLTKLMLAIQPQWGESLIYKILMLVRHVALTFDYRKSYSRLDNR